jgi:hypothetical protein
MKLTQPYWLVNLNKDELGVNELHKVISVHQGYLKVMKWLGKG